MKQKRQGRQHKIYVVVRPDKYTHFNCKISLSYLYYFVLCFQFAEAKTFRPSFSVLVLICSTYSEHYSDLFQTHVL